MTAQPTAAARAGHISHPGAPGQSGPARAGRPAPDFFILTIGRSGSTLLARMLDMHPRIRMPAETGLLRYTFAASGRFTGRVSALNNAQVFQAVGTGGQEQTGGRRFATPADLFEAFAAHYRRFDDELIGDKTPGDWRFRAVIRAHLPQARLVFLLRHPLAVINSLRHYRMTPYPAPPGPADRSVRCLVAALIWGELARAWLDVCAHEGAMLLRYEDLVSTPADCLQAVATHLGVAYEPAMLGYHRHAWPLSAHAHHANLASPPAAELALPIDTLSAEERAGVLWLLREELRATGYAADACSPPPGFARDLARARRWLRIGDTWQTLRGCARTVFDRLRHPLNV